MKKRALFITFEGIEGVGKSTQIRAVQKHFSEKGLKVFVTREPGGTSLGNAIRELLVRSSQTKMEPMTELFLLEAARYQHVTEVLQPELTRSDLILCDRFSDSSMAYQGGGRGVPIEIVSKLNELATDRLKPDLTILLDAPKEAALPRAIKRIETERKGSREDRFEKESGTFHQAVREAFLQLAKKEPNRIFLVDASQSEKSVTQTIVQKIGSLLKK